MCGIAGILQKQTTDTPAPIGRALLTMAACLQHRGMDSAGMAVFGGEGQGTAPSGHAAGRQKTLPEPQDFSRLADGRLYDLRPERFGFSACVRPAAGDAVSGRPGTGSRSGSGLPGATVSSLGASLTVEKAVGLADGLDGPVGGLTGTHGIAHLRLATESRIDPAHAQPFWGRPYPDIAVTHNGHITNYHKLRQKFEARGFGFASRNDSEIIGIYLGEKMASGLTLHRSLDGGGARIGRLVLVHRRHARRPGRRPRPVRHQAAAVRAKPTSRSRWPPSRRRCTGCSAQDSSNQGNPATGGARMGEGLKTFDCAGRTTREINAFLKEAARMGPEADVALLQPGQPAQPGRRADDAAAAAH